MYYGYSLNEDLDPQTSGGKRYTPLCTMVSLDSQFILIYLISFLIYLQIRGSHVGTHLPSTGVWHHTQRLLRKGVSNPKIIHHLDFDAPTREHAQALPDDKVYSYLNHVHLLSS